MVARGSLRPITQMEELRHGRSTNKSQQYNLQQKAHKIVVSLAHDTGTASVGAEDLGLKDSILSPLGWDLESL